MLLLLFACADNKTDTGAISDSGTPEVTADCPEAANFPVLTADPANSDYADPSVEVSCTDTELIVRSNGIPAYAYVPTTPNGLAEQDFEWRVPRYPEEAAATTEIPLLGTAGFAVNGLPAYGPNEAEFPDPYGDPVYNDLLDACLGHTGGNADYHYHAMLTACVRLGTTETGEAASPLIGYAGDGFPIYGPYCCADTSCSSVLKMESTWEQVGDPTTYAWDAYEIVEQDDPSILDSCNGHHGPDGTYHYHTTDGFPYILGCYRGTSTLTPEGGPPP